jgi:hypothetical protein
MQLGQIGNVRRGCSGSLFRPVDRRISSKARINCRWADLGSCQLSGTRVSAYAASVRKRVNPGVGILLLRETKARITIWDRPRRGAAPYLVFALSSIAVGVRWHAVLLL